MLHGETMLNTNCKNYKVVKSALPNYDPKSLNIVNQLVYSSTFTTVSKNVFQV